MNDRIAEEATLELLYVCTGAAGAESFEMEMNEEFGSLVASL